MSGESSRASEKRKGSTYLQMACSYLLVFLLPVLVSSALIYYIFMEPVNEQAMQLTIDDARMAEEAGVEAPMCKVLTAMIRALEENYAVLYHG